MQNAASKRSRALRAAVHVRHVLLALPLVVGALGIMAMPLTSAVADPIEQTRTELNEWVETRRLIAREKRDWALGRDMLNERIELVQREIEAQRQRIADANKSITEADKKRDELVSENEKLKEASSALVEVVTSLEKRTQDLLKRLPGPIRDRVKPLAQRIPEDPAATKASLSERFQNVIGVLNEVNKFNRDITVISEVRELPDGTSAEVTTMYVGLGRAYYVGANGAVAGYGAGTAEGWKWTAANEIAPQVADAIAIVNNEKVASFVKLPIEIEKP